MGELDEGRLSQIADVVSIRKRLDLSVAEVIAIADTIPDRASGVGEPALREVLFGSQQSFELLHPALRQPNPGQEVGVSADVGKLIGALKTKEPDFLALVRHVVPRAGIDAGRIADPLVSELYRSARLAQALGIAQGELAFLEKAVPELRGATTVQQRLSAVLALADLKDRISKGSVSLGDLLSQLGIALDNKFLRSRAVALLESARQQTKDDERRRIIPGDFDRLDGISPENARAMLGI